MEKLTLGYSPCPNDTFIFYALINGRIDTGDLGFRVILQDVETLNQMARRTELDITKVSFHALGHLRENYVLLRSGGALGEGCGPLVITRLPCSMDSLRGKTIAVPGRLTTAFMLLQLYDPELGNNIKVMPFHMIPDAVGRGDVDAGLIIHESRFTYQKAGLSQVIDLGSWWEAETGLPIPLGGIIARRSLGRQRIVRMTGLIRNSLEYAYEHTAEPREYIRQHAQELDDKVIDQHIRLYVNDYSRDLGERGMAAVREFFRRAEEKNLISPSSHNLLE